MTAIIVHGTAVAIGEDGVLIRGRSGAGKSTLALQMIETPGGAATLISDDQVQVTREGAAVLMSAPEPIRGLLEVRGVGIIQRPSREPVPLRLVVDLLPEAECHRLPDAADSQTTVLDTVCRRLTLPFGDPAGSLRIRVALREWGGDH